MQSRRGGPDPFPEAKDHALLLWIDAVEPGRRPDGNRNDQQ